MNSKILTTHLERRAFVYLRQSTPHQVESNRESTERQYALADRAFFLGWYLSQIIILYVTWVRVVKPRFRERTSINSWRL